MLCRTCGHADRYHTAMRTCLMEGCKCMRFEFKISYYDDERKRQGIK